MPPLFIRPWEDLIDELFLNLANPDNYNTMKQRPPGVRGTGKLDSVKHGCLLAIDFLLLCSLALSAGTETGSRDQVLTEAFTLCSTLMPSLLWKPHASATCRRLKTTVQKKTILGSLKNSEYDNSFLSHVGQNFWPACTASSLTVIRLCSAALSQTCLLYWQGGWLTGE